MLPVCLLEQIAVLGAVCEPVSSCAIYTHIHFSIKKAELKYAQTFLSLLSHLIKPVIPRRTSEFEALGVDTFPAICQFNRFKHHRADKSNRRF